jgi:hypothetical protein
MQTVSEVIPDRAGRDYRFGIWQVGRFAATPHVNRAPAH